MNFIKRLLLLLGVNFAVIVCVSFVVSILGSIFGVESYGEFTSLLIFAFAWGFTGAIINLLLSKYFAKSLLNVKIIDPSNPGPYAWLVQKVYECSKKQGLRKMPEVGIYHSPEINAFATGPSKNNSLVAFSTGLLNSMNQDEIEGVIGHEVAHIANGDMVTMTLLQGVANAFVIVLSRLAASVLASRVDEGKRALVYNVVALVLEIFFMILASIVVFYFSRVREYRADRDSARTVGKEKMIAALEHLRKYYEPYDDQPALQTLKISGANRRSLLATLFSTHPRLEDRINKLRNSYY